MLSVLVLRAGWTNDQWAMYMVVLQVWIPRVYNSTFGQIDFLFNVLKGAASHRSRQARLSCSSITRPGKELILGSRIQHGSETKSRSLCKSFFFFLLQIRLEFGGTCFLDPLHRTIVIVLRAVHAPSVQHVDREVF